MDLIKKLSTLASRQIDNHVPLPNLKKNITRKTHYTQRKIPQNLSEESHCTIHHHYAKTPVLKFNKKNFSAPSSGEGTNYDVPPTNTRGWCATPRHILFSSLHNLSIPELSLSVA